MQDRSWNDTLLMKEACPPGGVSFEGDGGVLSVPSLDGEVYLDSVTELDSGDGDFPELSAFLSQDEMNFSLDLAREAMSDAGDPNDLDEPPVSSEHLPLYSETKDHALQDSTSQSADATSGKVTSNQSMPLSRPNQPCTAPESPEKFICQKTITPVYKQDRPRLVHGGLELNERAASATEFCSRAATFIEELSSIFKGSTRVEQKVDEDSSSPDSGYLSPRSHRLAMQQAQPPSSSSSSSEPKQEGVQQGRVDVGSDEHQRRGVSLDGPMAPPHFTQKLKSQEVAEGSPIRLECRVTGNPLPLVRAQKKTSSVSLTIHTSSPKSSESQPHRSTLVQPLSATPQRVQSPVSSLYVSDALVKAPPSFTKMLQDAQASEGQVVVLECRVRGSLPLRVQWFREGREIQDSPDFRILQKKPRSAAEPEEICTLVIAEAFPEDGGLFCCTASNQYGSVNSTAQLTVTPVAEEFPSNGVSGDESVFEDNQSFPPPPPPPTEISLLEVPPKTPPSAEAFQINELDIWPSITSLPVQVSTDKEPHESLPNRPLQNGQTLNKPPDENLPSPSSVKETAAPPLSPSAVKAPPLPTKPKPKLNAAQLKQLQDQILQEQQQPLPSPQEVPPPSPPLPPPPSFQELESSTMQTSTFNYARPKQFIAAQSPTTSGGPIGYSTQSSTSSSSSPLSPITAHKPFSRVTLPPFQQQPLLSKGSSVESPSSPSFPPPPPPFLSSATLSSPSGLPQDFPPPPPPPPVTSSPTRSDSSSPFTSTPQSPAGFLVSVLPATPPPPPPMNALGLPKGNGTIALPRKTTPRTPRIFSDSDIQGSKDAVIQDLERKLRFKEERLSNGQQRLTYEEKMARRLLGADNAATVFNTQQVEEEPVTQEGSSADSESVPQKEYKVSSFEQRLISEIEFRLERSPVEESDDDVQHDEDAPGEVAPIFDQKLKHYKVFEGMPVTFSCKVIGDPMPKVYWFKDGKQISKRSEHYRISRDPDGTCSLHTAAASLDDDGNYTIMAGNPAGRVSCTGRMMVQAVNQRGRSQRSTPGHIRRPRSRSRDSGDENENIQERHFRPHFLQAPGDLIVQEGKLCRMDCKVSGLPTPDLIWQLNGQTIRPDSSHKMLVRENGVHSLVIEPVTSRDAGVYTCIASNRAGQNSFNLELIVAAKEMHKAPCFIEKLQNTSVAEGHPVRLECRVSGAPFPQIFWKKENESFTHNTDRISIHQDNFGYLCMIIQPALKEDAGWYTVSAKNEAGIISSTARLDVHAQWQQTHTPKPKKVRPSTSRYAALTERGLDVKAAFFPDSNPLPPGALVESDDL
ncbi:unnamed protein product [Leuciscus chuanchicus]